MSLCSLKNYQKDNSYSCFGTPKLSSNIFHKKPISFLSYRGPPLTHFLGTPKNKTVLKEKMCYMRALGDIPWSFGAIPLSRGAIPQSLIVAISWLLGAIPHALGVSPGLSGYPPGMAIPSGVRGYLQIFGKWNRKQERSEFIMRSRASDYYNYY